MLGLPPGSPAVGGGVGGPSEDGFAGRVLGWRSGLAACFFGSGRRGAGRSGRGTVAPAGTSISKRAATCGSSGPSRRTVATSSSLRCSGGAAGVTCARTGENAAASSTAAHRSGPSPGCSEAVAASARRLASAPGNGTPALGGTDESRRARTTRPTSSAASTSVSHSDSSSSCLVTSAAFSVVASSRVDSSRATTESSDAATTLRRSRRSRWASCRCAASARSSQSATRSRGISSSAIFSTAASGIVGLPSAASRAFSSRSRWRTAPMP